MIIYNLLRQIMTLTKIDYSKTLIYKIVCKDLSVAYCYVGSTTNFDQRKKSHKTKCYSQCSDKYHYQLYTIIRQYGGWENWSMIIIEKVPCNDSYEARKAERLYYEKLNANLNMIKPLCTEEERKQNEKERKQTEQYKDSQKKNRSNKQSIILLPSSDEKKEAVNSDGKITCSCGSVITRKYKASHEKTFLHISKTQALFKPTDDIIHA
jgi:hypothetical protein